jgi:hypothetical protein
VAARLMLSGAPVGRHLFRVAVSLFLGADFLHGRLKARGFADSCTGFAVNWPVDLEVARSRCMGSTILEHGSCC